MSSCQTPETVAGELASSWWRLMPAVVDVRPARRTSARRSLLSLRCASLSASRRGPRPLPPASSAAPVRCDPGAIVVSVPKDLVWRNGAFAVRFVLSGSVGGVWWRGWGGFSNGTHINLGFSLESCAAAVEVKGGKVESRSSLLRKSQFRRSVLLEI